VPGVKMNWAANIYPSNHTLTDTHLLPLRAKAGVESRGF
jgi:hypothetical protein